MTKFNCERLLSKLDDLIDGTLDEVEATAAGSHLKSCPSCRSELESVRELLTATRSLPRSTEPEHDLWSGIAEKIEQRRVVRGGFDRPRAFSSRSVWLAAAAAAVLVMSVTTAYMVGLERGRPQIAEAPQQHGSYMQAAYGDLATDLEIARDQLRASLDQRQDELSPETWSVVMDNLVVIDDAIERIETAMTDNPDDGRLNRQLTVAYRRQIDLLQRATRLPAEV